MLITFPLIFRDDSILPHPQHFAQINPASQGPQISLRIYLCSLLQRITERKSSVFYIFEKQVCYDYSGTPNIKSRIERVCRQHIWRHDKMCSGCG